MENQGSFLPVLPTAPDGTVCPEQARQNHNQLWPGGEGAAQGPSPDPSSPRLRMAGWRVGGGSREGPGCLRANLMNSWEPVPV